MDSCKIEKSTNGFKILGLMNFETVMHLYQQGTLLFGPYEKIQLDFAEVVHADSSAIALLLNWLRFAKVRRKLFVFNNLPGQLLEIANVCEVMPLLSQYVNHTK